MTEAFHHCQTNLVGFHERLFLLWSEFQRYTGGVHRLLIDISDDITDTTSIADYMQVYDSFIPMSETQTKSDIPPCSQKH